MTLDLSHNNLFHVPEDMSKARNVIVLSLSHNNISSIPGTVSLYNLCTIIMLSVLSLSVVAFSASYLSTVPIFSTWTSAITNYVSFLVMLWPEIFIHKKYCNALSESELSKTSYVRMYIRTYELSCDLVSLVCMFSLRITLTSSDAVKHFMVGRQNYGCHKLWGDTGLLACFIFCNFAHGCTFNIIHIRAYAYVWATLVMTMYLWHVGNTIGAYAIVFLCVQNHYLHSCGGLSSYGLW